MGLTESMMVSSETPTETRRVYTSVCFIDVVKSSDKWTRFPQIMPNLLKALDKTVREAFSGWLLVKKMGDGFMLVKVWEESVDEAPEKTIVIDEMMLCGKSLQREMKTQAVFQAQGKKQPFSLEVRIGMASGWCQETTENIQNHKVKDYYGATLNTASRMESKLCTQPYGFTFTLMDPVKNQFFVSAQDVTTRDAAWEIQEMNVKKSHCDHVKSTSHRKRSERMLHHICTDDVKGVGEGQALHMFLK